jgi:hypothetical protein
MKRMPSLCRGNACLPQCRRRSGPIGEIPLRLPDARRRLSSSCVTPRKIQGPTQVARSDPGIVGLAEKSFDCSGSAADHPSRTSGASSGSVRRRARCRDSNGRPHPERLAARVSATLGERAVSRNGTKRRGISPEVFLGPHCAESEDRRLRRPAIDPLGREIGESSSRI